MFVLVWTRITFLTNLVQNIKNGSLRRDLACKTKFSMLNFIVMLTFSVLYQKDLFWANLIKRLETVCLRWNLISSLLQICWIYNGVHLASFRLEISFRGKFCLENQDCLFKMKVFTFANLNRLNLVVMFICATLGGKYHFSVTLIQKIKIICCGKTLVYRPNQIFWISWLRLFFVLEWKYRS